MARTRGEAFTPIALVRTEANGNYSFPAQSPANSTFYRVVTNNDTCALVAPTARACRQPHNEGQVKSAVLFEGVRDVLTAQVSPTTVQAGGQLTFSGTVAPSAPGHVVYLERRNASGEGFHVVQVATLDQASSFSIVHTVYDVGAKVFRIYVPGGPANQGAASQPFDVQVTPAPATALLPEAPGNSSQPPEGSEGPGESREGTEGL
jgi:hypothetical protein